MFVDTNVVLGYLRGEESAARLFAAEAEGLIRIAVNPIVLQELLLNADAIRGPEFKRIQKHLEVLPLDFAAAEALVPRIRALRNRVAHSNDILILSSTAGCDFLVTGDARLKTLVRAKRPRVVTPEELATQLQAA